MTQAEINEAEWRNPDNWSGGLYFSKKDSRVWVPKRIKCLGWTINIGQQKGAAWLIGIVVGSILFVVLLNIIVINIVGHK